MDLRESLARTLRVAGFDESDTSAIADGSGGERLPSSSKLALLALDLDQVQATVLASPRPVTIFGASLSIQRWDARVREGRTESLPEASTVLFAGGGNAVVLLPASDEAKVARIAEATLEELGRETRATATAAWRLVSPRELARGPAVLDVEAAALRKLGLRAGGGGFGEWLGVLSRDLRRRKGGDRQHPFLTEPLDGLRCDECALRPKAGSGQRCERCAEYRDLGGREKQDEKFEQARTFDDVLKGARKIAFVFVDGRGIAGQLARLRTIEEYHRVSTALREAFELDAERARRLGLVEGEHNVVLRGGDDLLLVVPAATRETNALAFTAALLRDIESHLDVEPLRGKLGAGAGVVMTSGLPADFAFDLAHDLCERAKGRLAGDGGGDRSAIDFAVVASGAMFSESGKVQDRREVALGTARVTEKVELSQRPYTLSRFEALLELADRVDSSGAGRSSLVALRDALDQSPETAALSWAYQLARHRRLREAFGASLDRPVHDLSEWLFHPMDGDGGWATAVPDLIEVLRVRRGR